MTRRTTLAAGLLIFAALFVAINLLAGAALRSAKVDFTEAGLYTLSDGTREIIAAIDEPITLDFYFSSKLAAGRPALQAYGKRVRELLEEYERLADGKIILRLRDPEPFSDLEDLAVQLGLQGVPVGDGGERLYFGLAAANSVSDRSVIPFFDPQQERFLEYEISRMLYLLSNPEKRVLGVITSLEIGGVVAEDNPQQADAPAWQIAREMGALFDVKRISPETARLPEDLDVLAIIHPKDLPEPVRYAIDQYVLSGGKVMVFVDPHSESDLPEDPSDQFAVMTHDTASDLPGLLSAWGVSYTPDVVAADAFNAQNVLYMVAPGRREPMNYVVWLGLGEDNLNREHPVTGRLRKLALANAGVLDAADGATTTFTRLAWTSAQSMRMDTVASRAMPDPKRLMTQFEPQGEELTVAAMVTGPASSAFPAGPPEGSNLSAEAHLDRSIEPINVIVVADTDLLADRFWLSQNAFGAINKIADNGDFVINGLDQLAGSSALIGLRARGEFARPFERVEALRADAEARFRARELELEDEIRQTEARIQQIRFERPDSTDVVDPEVRREIASLNGRLLDARKELRDVQLNLRRDVERLGTTLKIINIGLAPAIIAVVALGLGLYRSARRRADRRAMAHH